MEGQGSSWVGCFPNSIWLHYLQVFFLNSQINCQSVQVMVLYLWHPFASFFPWVSLGLTYLKANLVSDINRPTRLCMDANQQGLGFIQQRKCGGYPEFRYIVIQLKLLAMSQAIQSANFFLWKCHIFRWSPSTVSLNFEAKNPKLQCFNTYIMPYNFITEWSKNPKFC